jgi:hypothetical protein
VSSRNGAKDQPVVGGTGVHGDALKRRRRPPPAPEEQARRLLSGAAWSDFCEALRAAGEQVLAPEAPNGDLDRAEGFRYLAGLVVSGLQQARLFADPERPRFFRNPDGRAKWGAENADNLYLWARVRSDRVYRLRGWRGSVYDFLIEVKEGYMQLGDDRNFAVLSARELSCEPDGSFEIVLGGERRPGNWLPLHRDAGYVAIREYFWDWDREQAARFEISLLDPPPGPPPPLEPAAAAALLDSAGEWIETSTRFWSEWVEQLRAGHRRNQVAPARRYVGGADDIRYGNDVFRLEPDEALVLETEVPRARYWGFQLCNLWFESLDYAHRQTSLNGQQARVDADGRVRCVVAHRDPGVPNWLDTAGHREGVLQYRWIWSQTSPQPRARVVAFDRVRDALPPDTPRVSPEQRRAVLLGRSAHVARREPVG